MLKVNKISWNYMVVIIKSKPKYLILNFPKYLTVLTGRVELLPNTSDRLQNIFQLWSRYHHCIFDRSPQPIFNFCSTIFQGSMGMLKGELPESYGTIESRFKLFQRYWSVFLSQIRSWSSNGMNLWTRSNGRESKQT